MTIEGLEHGRRAAPAPGGVPGEPQLPVRLLHAGLRDDRLSRCSQEGHELDEAEIREELSGNLCRCTGYQSIVEGVQLAAAGCRPIGRRRATSGGGAR